MVFLGTGFVFSLAIAAVIGVLLVAQQGKAIMGGASVAGRYHVGFYLALASASGFFIVAAV